MSKNKKYSQEFDAQFEAFLNESLSTCSDVSVDTGRISKILDGSHHISRFSAIEDNDDEVDSDTEFDWQSRNRFLKKSKLTEAAQPPKPSPRSAQQMAVSESEKHTNSSMNSFHEDGTITNNDIWTLDAGKETLEELEEKARFFQKLEENVNKTPDYGKLNQELDQSDTFDTSAVPGDTTIDQLINGNIETKFHEGNNVSKQPNFQKAGNVKEKTNRDMLSQVALLDSTLDSTFDKKSGTAGEKRIGGAISDDMRTITEHPTEKSGASSARSGASSGAGGGVTGASGGAGSGRSGASDKSGADSGASVIHREIYVDATPQRWNANSARSAASNSASDVGNGASGRGNGARGRGNGASGTENGANGVIDATNSATGPSNGTNDANSASLIQRDTYVDAASRRRHISSDTDRASEVGEGDISRTTSTPGNYYKTSSGLGNTDTHRDLEAMRNEMKRYGVTNQGSFDSTSALIQETSGFEPGTLEPGVEDVNYKTNEMSQKPVKSTTRERQDGGTNDRVRSHCSNDQPTVTFNDQTMGSNSSLGGTQTKSGFYKRPRNLPTGQRDSTVKRLKDKDRYAHVKGSGYNQRASASKKISAAKSLSSPDGFGRTKEQTFTDDQLSGFDDRTIMESINSLTNFLSARFSADSDPRVSSERAPHLSSEDSPVRRKPLKQSTLKGSDLRGEVTYWQDMYREEKRVREKLKNDMEEMEAEFKKRQEALQSENEQILYKLKQENFTLSCKVEDYRKRLLAKAKDSGVTNDSQLTHLEEELRHQETLLAGYQTENERMFNEIKNLQQASKTTEERLIKENLKIKSELVRAREECNQKEVQLMSQTVEVTHNGVLSTSAVNSGALSTAVLNSGAHAFNSGVVGTAALGSGRITQLESELKLAKTQEEMNRSAMGDMERRIEQLLRKNRDLEDELRLARDCQSLEAKGLEERYKKEMEHLRKKLHWYSENQQLLDQDMERLKSKEAEVKLLRQKLDENQTVTGKSKTEATSRKEKSWEAKRIQDLERQVKEMENILKKRDPNSLPVLMWAASHNSGAVEGSNPKPPSILYLESQVKRLQEEIEDKDEEAKRSLRAVEQKYNSIKLKYEERILQLEERVSHLTKELEFKPQPHSNVSTVQRELEAVKDKHKKVCGDYEQELNNLRAEVLAARSSKLVTGKTLSAGTRKQVEENEKIKFRVQRLEDEKSQLLTDLRVITERLAKANVKLSLDGKITKRRDAKSRSVNHLSNLDSNRLTTTLGGGTLSDVVIENGLLRKQIEDLHSEIDQQKKKLQTIISESEHREQILQEGAEKKIAELKSLHHSDLNRRLTASAVEYSSSKVSELSSQVTTQKVVIDHLQSQIVQLSKAAEEVSALRQVQVNLEAQLKKTSSDLIEARRSHTPQMRQFEQLQTKIEQMEERHRQREDQLQQLLQQNRQLAVQDIEAEANKWRRVLESKNREIDKFRTELDSILNVLRELRRQGVVIPYTTDFVG